MLPVIDWNLTWTIACGVLIGLSLLGLLSLVGRMWQDNWKVTVLVILCFAIFPATVIGAFLGYFGWIWLIPGFIAGGVCYFVATNILVKEEGDDSENY